MRILWKLRLISPFPRCCVCTLSSPLDRQLLSSLHVLRPGTHKAAWKPHCSCMCSISQMVVWDFCVHGWWKGHQHVTDRSKHNRVLVHLINAAAVVSWKWLPWPDLNKRSLVLKRVWYSFYARKVQLHQVTWPLLYFCWRSTPIFRCLCLRALIRNALNVAEPYSVFLLKSFWIARLKIFSWIHQVVFFYPLPLFQMLLI